MDFFHACSACADNGTGQTVCCSASPLGIPYGKLMPLAAAGHLEAICRHLLRHCAFPSVLLFLGDSLASKACIRGSQCPIPRLFELLASQSSNIFYAPESLPAPTGKRAAVLGSGPAGLQAAYTLCLHGHEVTVYEAAPQAGMTLLFPPVQESSSAAPEPAPAVPEAVLKACLATLEGMGVAWKTSRPVGQSELPSLRQKYHAVVCACGKGTVLPAKNGNHAEGNLFGAGTCLKNQKLMNALQAMQSGKLAAEAVHRFLS